MDGSPFVLVEVEWVIRGKTKVSFAGSTGAWNNKGTNVLANNYADRHFSNGRGGWTSFKRYWNLLLLIVLFCWYYMWPSIVVILNQKPRQCTSLKSLEIWGEINKLWFDACNFTTLTIHFYNEKNDPSLWYTEMAFSMQLILHNLFYWHLKPFSLFFQPK